jgi:predicted ATPase/DNA-binding SARP family transcriptional activator
VSVVRIGILGPLEAQRGDHRLALGGERVRALLARLALDADRAVPATALADAIWDGALPGDEQHALQSLVSRLRGALGEAGLVQPTGSGYRLAVDAEDVDATRFARLAAEGASRLGAGDPSAASAVLSEALALWRGPALADLRLGSTLGAAAASLDALRVSARADRAQAEIELGRSAGLVAELEALAAEQPMHERIAGQLMQALCAAGRQADALAVYERVRRRLDAELGVSPSAELQEVHLAVVRGEVAAPAPSAAVPRAPHSNLPVRLTSFVGRERDLTRVGELLRSHRLLTLVGAGGAGKTRLAEQLAHRAAGELGEGAWLVELAPVADGEAIVPAILASLGLREVELIGARSSGASADALARLLELLADREALVVLDNCEHLLEPTAQVADRLLGACPRLRLLCTSREPLGITGEMIVPLSPLELPDRDVSAAQAMAVPAVRLFADRAAAASAGFLLDEDTVAGVVEVCRRVDGLPLAIELAAARLRSMTLPQLAARLDDRFRLLTGGSRTAMPRQRTLRAVVDWSWDLLDERERALLRRLAVFSGPVTLETAELVCAGGVLAASEVFDLLCALVDKSLLQITSGESARYRLLETIREYGLERLREAGELEQLRETHSRHFAELALTAGPLLRGPDQLAWLARLRAEHDDVLAALRYLGEAGEAVKVSEVVVALLWFWLLAGSRQEVVTWTSFAQSVPGEADPLDRALIDGVHALSELVPGGSEGRDPWHLLGEVLERIEDADLSAHPLLAAVRPLLAITVGRERVTELLEGSVAHPDPWVRATVPFVRVQLAENDGDLETMQAALDESLRAFGEIGDRWGLATTLSELSSLRIVAGDLDGAEEALKRTRVLMTELGSDDAGGMLRMRLADVRARRGDLEGARTMLAASLGERERFEEETAMIMGALAHLELRLGDLPRARELSLGALATLGPARRAKQGHAHAMALGTAALIEIESGALEAGEARLREAHELAVGTSDMPIVAAVGVVSAALEQRRGDEAAGAEILGAAARLRGAEDPTHPEVARLTTELRGCLGADAFQDAFARGRALDREEALVRLRPPGELDPAAVGAQRERHEHGEQDPHPGERPEHI